MKKLFIALAAVALTACVKAPEKTVKVYALRNGNRYVGIIAGGTEQSALLYAEKACCNLVLRSPCCLAVEQNTAMEKTACF